MARFQDQYLPTNVPGYPCVTSPRWSTQIARSDSGAEQANQRWSNPLWRYNLPDAVRTHDVVEALRHHWMDMRGPAHTFPFKDPFDFASVDLSAPNVTPTLSATDQAIGTGDGATVNFQLVKGYGTINPYSRPIYLPVLSSVLIGLNTVDTPAGSPPIWSVSRPGGIVTFATPPGIGVAITAGFLFDVEVRFESDDQLDAIIHTYQVSRSADFGLVGVRRC